MKRILIFILVLCACQGWAQEITKDSINVYRDTTVNVFFEYRELQYDDGSSFITVQNIGDTSQAYNYLKNIVYDQNLLLQRGIKLAYDNDNESNATRNLIDPFLIIVDSTDYWTWTVNAFSGRYTGIWLIKTVDTTYNLQFDIPDGYAFSDRIRVREVVWDAQNSEWDIVTPGNGGVSGNIKLEANNMFSINSVFAANWTVAKSDRTDALGRALYGASTNDFILWIKKIE